MLASLREQLASTRPELLPRLQLVEDAAQARCARWAKQRARPQLHLVRIARHARPCPEACRERHDAEMQQVLGAKEADIVRLRAEIGRMRHAFTQVRPALEELEEEGALPATSASVPCVDRAARSPAACRAAQGQVTQLNSAHAAEVQALQGALEQARATQQ